MSFYPGAGGGGSFYNNFGGYGFGNNGSGMEDYSQHQETQRNEGPYEYKNREGIITKLQQDFGIIDDEVYFPLNTVVGFRPRVGDRVHAEAVFNPKLQPRWKAVKVTALSNRQIERPNVINEIDRELRALERDRLREQRLRERERERERERDREREKAAREREAAERETKRREEKRVERERETRDTSVTSSRKRSRSPKSREGGSPPRRRPRVPKYAAVVPKWSTDMLSASITDVRRRCAPLYVPSDFFYTKSRWQESFPLKAPLSLDHVADFHIFHKDVQSPGGPRNEAHPPDADYKFSAKVMLMSLTGMEELYKKTLVLAESGEDRQGIHPFNFLKFLVGTKGKNELIPIGGPWSPSADGANPESEPQVLIKTAIRTCKMLTGIDLSNCTQWCRFMEIHYRRPETATKPATVETVVIYLPDVWNCMPTLTEWTAIKEEYKNILDQKLTVVEPLKEAEEAPKVESEKAAPVDDKVKVETPVKEEVTPSVKEKTVEQDSDPTEAKTLELPKIDIQNMKVVEIKAELEARGLNTKGIKSELCARLAEALEKEEQEALAADEEMKEILDEAFGGDEGLMVTPETGAVKEEDVKEETGKAVKEVKEESADKKPVQLSEKERKHLERIYTISRSAPAIPLHPSTVAKKGEFDCDVVTLKGLLDIHANEIKEHTFEVYLFAQMFQDLMFRDCGYRIYKTLFRSPNLVEEEKKARKEEELAKKEQAAAAAAEADLVQEGTPVDSKILEQIPLEEGVDEDMLSTFVVVDQLDDEDTKGKKTEPSKMDSKKDSKAPANLKPGKSSETVDKPAEKKKVKQFTADKDLLFSFVCFDVNQCGYILDKDVEELLLHIGLRLSRSQVKRLISKVVGKTSFYYRQLTDKPVPEVGAATAPTDGMETQDSEEELTGNLNLCPDLEGPQGKSSRTDASVDSAVVSYNGRVYNLDQLLHQSEKYEKDRTEADTQLKKIQDELAGLKSKYDSTSSKLRRSEDDVKSLKSKLSGTESKLKDTKIANDKFVSALKLVYHHVSPFVAEKKEEKRPDSPATQSENNK